MPFDHLKPLDVFRKALGTLETVFLADGSLKSAVWTTTRQVADTTWADVTR